MPQSLLLAALLAAALGAPAAAEPFTLSTFETPAELALGGHFQLDVADMDAAIDWAGRLPAARTGAVEVRAGYPAPGM